MFDGAMLVRSFGLACLVTFIGATLLPAPASSQAHAPATQAPVGDGAKPSDGSKPAAQNPKKTPPKTASPDKPKPPTPAEIKQALQALERDEAKAEAPWLKWGPQSWPQLTEGLSAEAKTRWLPKLAEGMVEATLNESIRRDPGVRFHGQFAELIPLGEPGAKALMKLLVDEDRSVDVRVRVAGALGDLKVTSVRPQLRAVLEDFLTERWLEREVGYLLARLGDREYVDRVIQRHRAALDQEVTRLSLPAILDAHQGLSEVYYRVEEFDQAVRHYESRLTILRDLKGRIDPELRDEIANEIRALHYNLACSLSRGGNAKKALAALKVAIGSREITWKMIREDGDLVAVRKLAEFETWRRETQDEAVERKPGSSEPASGG